MTAYDSFGIQGTILHYSIVLALVGSTLVRYLFLEKRVFRYG